ncbi:MAG: hypothetical protein AAGU21_14230 [Solidesulfovibrio sp.]|uniref:hypothetical protein n=1 Tax=Solidesulfovibrio sp. TaxID=2910990 RepID=UPI002B21D2A9|nr:hypothetical protein [Solidesulfovibrio sp.]MEA4856113.1 hypothetical protein [Solidesulfovibrio sp.]
MAWDQSAFDAALKKKYEVAGQQADADTTRANAAAQDVSQRPEIQARSDAAAMQRAKLASQTQLGVAGMGEQGATARAQLNANTQTGIASMQDRGATARTGMQTGAQLQIAGMENQLGRDRLNQQGQQFGRSFALDSAKALDTSRRGWADLGRPTYGDLDTYNKETKRYEPTIKIPGVTPSAVNPLEQLQGAQDARAAAAGARQGGIGDETPEDIRKRRITVATGASGPW